MHLRACFLYVVLFLFLARILEVCEPGYATLIGLRTDRSSLRFCGGRRGFILGAVSMLSEKMAELALSFDVFSYVSSKMVCTCAGRECDEVNTKNGLLFLFF